MAFALEDRLDLDLAGTLAFDSPSRTALGPRIGVRRLLE